MRVLMRTCWDCRRFGEGCEGMLLDGARRNRMDVECPRFVPNAWARDIYQREGTRRL
jgi:hypothetical protein